MGALEDRGKLDRSGSADDRPSDLDARRRDLIGTQCADALVGVAAFSTALFRARRRFVAGCPIGGRLVPGVLATTGGQQQEIGRAPCRERECQYGWISVGAVKYK